MIVIIVIALVLLATACANVWIARRANDDALIRHERALEALRDLAEHPRPVAADLRTHPETEPDPAMDHIRILHEPPAGMVPHRRRTGRTGSVRARPTTRRRRVAPAAAAPAPPAPNTPPAPPAPPAPNTPPATPARIVVPVQRFDAVAEAAPVAELPSEPVILPARRSGRLATVAAVAAVVVLVGAASALAVASGHKTRHAAARAVRPVVTTTVAPAVRVPPTVAVPPVDTARFTATPNGDGTVTVRLPFSLTLAPIGPCWVRVQDSNGKTLFEGTLHAGQHQEVTGTSPLVIRLGNTPAMQMLVNGSEVALAGAAQTADVRFVPPT